MLNRRFTPVTHPLMATAAPGQLSVSELMSRRLQEHLISPRNFYLFGTPIQQSLSPSMHNGKDLSLLQCSFQFDFLKLNIHPDSCNSYNITTLQ